MNEQLRQYATERMTDMLTYMWGDAFRSREDMQRTPQRFVDALAAMTTPQPFEFTTFPTDLDEMVIVRDIHFNSVCAHHLLPFIGTAHVGYVPNGKMAGLSKLARTVHYCAAAPHVQEELTDQIASMLTEHLDPKGVAVVLRAEHTCMTVRGVKAHQATTVTSKMTGVFADHDRLARAEFMEMIR